MDVYYSLKYIGTEHIFIIHQETLCSINVSNIFFPRLLYTCVCMIKILIYSVEQCILSSS